LRMLELLGQGSLAASSPALVPADDVPF
jgi:hypothetical protein